MGGFPQRGSDGVVEKVKGILLRAERKANTGSYSEAEQLYERVAGLCKDKHPELVGESFLNLGNIALDQSRYEDAKKRYDWARTVFDFHKPESFVIKSLACQFQIGRILQAQGFLQLAGYWASSAVNELECLKQEKMVAIGYNTLGLMEWQTGHPRKASKYINDSLKIKEKLGGMERGIAASLVLRCLVTSNTQFYSARDSTRVHDDITRALEIYKKAEDVLGLAHLFYTSGRIQELWSNSDEAEIEYRRTLDIASDKKHPFPKGKAVALQGLARRHGNRKYHAEAVKIFKKLDCNPAHIPKTPTSLDKILETFV